jgi:hypothetical protein
MGGSTIPAPPAAGCGSPTPPPAVIRRLTRREYNNTIRDLLGDTSNPANAFPVEEEAFGFDNNAHANGISEVLAEQYQAAAEQIAARAVADARRLGAIAGCDLATGEACVRAFVTNFGKRAFRRPLETPERDRIVGLYTAARARYDATLGLQMVLQAFLQSPHFLYRAERGEPPRPGQAFARLTGFEIATRLAYMFWGTMPDDELFAAAEQGALATAAGIEKQARRMLDANDKRARALVADFHDQWLNLPEVDEMDKSTTTYGSVGYKPELRPAMRAETQSFVDAVFWGDGKLGTLLTAPYSYMNGALATFYGGVSNAPTGSTFQKVDLNPAQRAGLLTHAALLALHSKRNQTSPVHRGLFVRRDFLCFEPPAPPQIEGISPPALSSTLTTAERWSRHSQDPACAGCHSLIDPIGLGFESYDGVGRYRATENGKTIDPRGEIKAADVAGPFTGAVELGKRLAASEDVRGCVSMQWYRYAFGTSGDSEADGCTLRAVKERFAASGHNLRELVIALTQTDAFVYRALAAGGTP